jgi:hypothetical protein
MTETSIDCAMSMTANFMPMNDLTATTPLKTHSHANDIDDIASPSVSLELGRSKQEAHN